MPDSHATGHASDLLLPTHPSRHHHALPCNTVRPIRQTTRHGPHAPLYARKCPGTPALGVWDALTRVVSGSSNAQRQLPWRRAACLHLHPINHLTRCSPSRAAPPPREAPCVHVPHPLNTVLGGASRRPLSQARSMRSFTPRCLSTSAPRLLPLPIPRRSTRLRRLYSSASFWVVDSSARSRGSVAQARRQSAARLK